MVFQSVLQPSMAQLVGSQTAADIDLLIAANFPFMLLIIDALKPSSPSLAPSPAAVSSSDARELLLPFASRFVDAMPLLIHDLPSSLLLQWWFSQYLEISTMV
jgi:hypothetical protein